MSQSDLVCTGDHRPTVAAHSPISSRFRSGLVLIREPGYFSHTPPLTFASVSEHVRRHCAEPFCTVYQTIQAQIQYVSNGGVIFSTLASDRPQILLSVRTSNCKHCDNPGNTDYCIRGLVAHSARSGAMLVLPQTLVVSKQ